MQPLTLTQTQIDTFLDQFQQKGRGESTLDNYRRALKKLSLDLPESQILDQQALVLWREKLDGDNCSIQTKNVRIAAVNSYVSFYGRNDLKLLPFRNKQPSEPEELSREEYLRLLQTAKAHENERLYLLIKTLCVTGIPLQDLPDITVESLRNGTGSLPHIPSFLKKELLDYAKHQNISSGSVFITRNGRPMERNNVYSSIRQLCQDAQVSGKKANPLCLRKLYQNTQAEILESFQQQILQKYVQLLEKEENSIGWNI